MFAMWLLLAGLLLRGDAIVTCNACVCRDLRDVVANNGLENLLKDTSQNLTMFAPIDFSEMRSSPLGLSLINKRLNAKRMKNVCYPHYLFDFCYQRKVVSVESQVRVAA